MVGWTCAYLVAVLASRLTYASEMPVALLWPAGGVAVVWAVSGGMRRLPLVAVGVTAAMGLHGLALPHGQLAVACFALAHAAQAAVVGGSYLWLRRRGDRPPWPEGTGGMVTLTACALGGAVVTLPLVWWGTVLLYGESSHEVAIAWVVRNTASTLVVGVLLLELLRARRTGEGPGTRPTRGDLAVLLLGVGSVAVLLRDPSLAVTVPFAAMALLVWVGARLSPLWAALAVCTLVALSTEAVVQGAPPFAAIEDPMRRAFVFQVFSGLAALTTLALSHAGQERARLSAALARSHRHSSRRAQLLQTIAGAMTEQVLVHDEQHRLVWANGDVAEGVVLRGLDGRALEPAEHPVARAFAGETVTGARYRSERPDGRPAVVEVGASLLPEREGASAERLVVLVVRDVTDQHQRDRQLQAFAGAVAHDLKTPLTGALGYVQMARDELGDLDGHAVDIPLVRRLLDRSEAAGQRMDRLIRDLLDLSASDRARLHLTRLGVVEVARQVAAEVREAHPEARVELPTADAFVEAEPRLLRQLLLNILGNAVKYSTEGERPHVTVAVRPAGDRVLVSVADRGVGIPVGEEDMIFEPFRRASNHGQVAGSGLGLATCAWAVERHGGRIHADANPCGRGTVVTFDLPAAAEHEGERDQDRDPRGADQVLASPPDAG